MTATFSSNVYQSFRRINVISRIFGVMPLKMTPGDRTTGPICVLSSLDYAYSFALLVVSVAHGVLAPFYVLHTISPHEHEHSMFVFVADRPPPTDDGGFGQPDDEEEASEMATAMKILNPIMVSVSSVCTRLVALTFLHRRLSEFIAVLHRTDRLMAAADGPRVARTDTVLQTFDKYLLRYFALVGVPVNVYYVFTASTVNSKAGTVWCVVLAFNNLACFSADMQFIRCACMLNSRFKFVNDQLESIASVWHFKRGVLVEKITCRAFLSELSYGQKICDSIEMYRYCFGQFCNMVCQLNSTYQLHLLGSISACFLKVLFNLYFSMFGYVVGTNGLKEQDELIRAICWNIFYGMRFLTIIYVANTTSKQADYAKTLITDISNRYLDSSTKEELQLFYTQISSRPIEFTACDLFTLNTRLITSAIAAGATYLVILVQFHSGKN